MLKITLEEPAKIDVGENRELLDQGDVSEEKDDSNKLLVVQDTTNDTWEVPGGGLDHGETIKQAAVREIQEELGVALQALTLRLKRSSTQLLWIRTSS